MSDSSVLVADASMLLDASKEHEDRVAFNKRSGIRTTHIATMVHHVNTVWILRRLEQQFQNLKDMTVIEIGAGVGVFAVNLAERCKRVFAIEADPLFSREFAVRLYADKPSNLTWVFDVAVPEMAARNGGWLPRADLVLVLTGSDEENLRDLAEQFGDAVVMPWQDWNDGVASVDCRRLDGPPPKGTWPLLEEETP